MIGRFTASLFSIAGLLAMLPILSQATSPLASATVIKESRHLVDAGKWDEAGKLLEEQLKRTKDTAEVARLRAKQRIFFRSTKANRIIVLFLYQQPDP